jgi:hemerythrin-like domain-containing protein
MNRHCDRRRWIAIASASAVGFVAGPQWVYGAEGGDAQKKHEDVVAAEDLMREHGVLRRSLLVYREASSRLSHLTKGAIPAHELLGTAGLFRTFGEDYHERGLEEQYVFPPLIKAGGPNADLCRVLIAQHNRGRQITDYIVGAARSGVISAANATPLAKVLADFVRMYAPHAAIEDTVIFPAWKAAIPKTQYQHLSGQFEELERRTFGTDGFKDALRRIELYEQAFGIANLAALTAPAPPPPPG